MYRPRALAAAGALALAALTTGCSLGTEAYDGQSRPPEGTNAQQVVRTPQPVESDLPYTQPPLVAPLPGPTGGVPGDTPVTAAPFSPGPDGARAATGEGGF